MHGQTPQYIYSGPGSTIGNVSPFGTTGNTRKQWIFSPSNFLPAPTSGQITAIYFRVGSSPTSSTFTNLMVRMGPTTLSTFVNGPFITAGSDTVFFATSHTVNIISSGPWLPITLQTPFYFNGTSNFLLDVSQGGYTSGMTIYQQTVAGKCLYGPSGATTATTADRLVEFGFDLLPGINDAGLEGFVNLPDTICQGNTPIMVTLKNHGPNALSSAKIGWKVNNLAQTVYNWSGSLAVNATTTVTIGNYPFMPGTAYQVMAYTSEPNSVPDTLNGNDTIVKPEIIIKPAPGVTLADTSLVICPGDSVLVTGTLTGTPPWDMVIHDGATPYNLSNITIGTFSFPFLPTATTTYTITSVTDATGCTNTSSPSLLVTVMPPPPANISATGPTTFCSGDSVMLMGTIGLNFTYEWFRDGMAIPSALNYILAAKTSGSYTVKVTNPSGCSAVSSPVSVTVHPLPVVFLGNDTNVSPCVTLQLNAGAGFNSYLWSTGATSQTIQVDSSGTGLGIKVIWVKVTDINGCTGGDTIHVAFVNNPGISELGNNADIRLFPNPSEGKVFLQFNRPIPGEIRLELYSSDGRMVLQTHGSASITGAMIELDTGWLAEGVYTLRIIGREMRLMEKMVLRR